MLLFIRVVQAKKAWYNYISIHLMLLFIFIREEYLTEEANFNTSHVTVYQKDWTAKVADSTISIHLMLLFIEEDHNKITGAKRISIHLMLLFIVMYLGNETDSF